MVSWRGTMRFLPLVVLGASLATLGYGFWSEHRSRGFDEAVEILLDGTPDREQRLEMLRVVAAGPDARAGAAPGSLARLQAAVAALLLGDPKPIEAEARTLPDWPRAELWAASLDEPAVASLLRGMIAKGAGDRVAADTAFAQARASARLYELPSVVALARPR